MESAETLYNERMAEIECLIELLQHQLLSHKVEFAENKLDHGYPGDLGHVYQKLDELTDFLGNAE